MTNLAGQLLSNRYLIEDSIGRGGMAEVYKAWDQERTVYLALKVLRQDLSRDVIFLRRFKREAQTLEKLQHPNIVRFYGIDKDDLTVYMLMDYIDGTTLQDEIFRSDGRACSQDFVLQIMKSVCSALHYAHQQGQVHCDIKPGNIMINKEGGIFITDFGIARMTDAATATLVGFGTPAYMAPELVQGRDPTPLSDIYSLGVVLYEMVTSGERPFTGEQASTTGSTSEKVRWEQVHLPPPSPRQYNPHLSTDFKAIILKCLEKNPQKRYTDVLEILNAIETEILKEQDLDHELRQGNQSVKQNTEQIRSLKREAGTSDIVKEVPQEPKPRPIDQEVIQRRKTRQRKSSQRLPWLVACLMAIGLTFVIFGEDILNRNPNPGTAQPLAEVRVQTEETEEVEAPDKQPALTQTLTSETSEETNIATVAPTKPKSPTRTPSEYMTPTPILYSPIPGCASSHLHVGDSAFVSYTGGNNHVRTEPDTAPSDNTLFDIYPGEVVQIISGPKCNYGWILWEIETTYQDSGWTPESDGEEFWLYPIAMRSICKDALPTRLVVGKKAKVNEEPPDSNLLREGPGRNYKVIDRIRPGRWMMVLEGPECGEAVNWWKVESLDTGTVGWTMEGNLDIYYLSPKP